MRPTASRMAGAWMLMLWLATASEGQQRPPRTIRGDGTEAFRAVLSGYGLKPLRSIHELRDHLPGEVLIVWFRGNRMAGDPLEIRTVMDFMQRGGAILAGTDLETGPNSWTNELGFNVARTRVAAATGAPRFANETACPAIVRRGRADPDLFREKSSRDDFGSLTSPRENLVYTNRPSYLLTTDELDTLGVFWPRYRFEGRSEVYGGDLPAVAGRLLRNGSRLLATSDQSIFINSMLLPQDSTNSNLDFTFNCLDWLIVGPGGAKREYVLMLSDGRVETDFDLILQALPPTTPSEILDYLRQHPEEIVNYLRKHPEIILDNLDKASPLLAELEDRGIFSDLEDRNVFNRLLLENFPLWVFVRNVLILGTLVLAGYGIRRLIAARRRIWKGVPRFAVALERYRSRGGLLEQRVKSALSTGQYYEAARDHARTMFAELHLTPVVEGPPPRVQIDAGWWSRGQIERDLNEIWRIAFGDDPRPISAKEWAQWPRRVDALRKKIEAGVITFG